MRRKNCILRRDICAKGEIGVGVSILLRSGSAYCVSEKNCSIFWVNAGFANTISVLCVLAEYSVKLKTFKLQCRGSEMTDEEN